MAEPVTAAANVGFVDWCRRAPWSRQVLLVLAGTVFLAACAWIEVPMVPVPMTMQTFGMVLIGAVYGWRLGGATVFAYLLEGAMGLPVFAGGAAGAHHLVGPTGGYLLGFLLAAMLVGILAERGLTRSLVGAFAAMLVGHVVIVALGVVWLTIATPLDLVGAFAAGAAPFLFGMAVKSALAVACLRLLERRRPTA